jgi:hypothetical protein
VVCLLTPSAASAGEAAAVSARSGLALATEAAHAWADDARLVYVENDESVGASGTAARWGYLFHSPARDRSRAYSVRDGKIVTAVNLDFDLDAPPVAGDWIDSVQALRAAETGGGRDYRNEHAGALRSMLLIRGAFHHDDPDRTTWTFVYDSTDAPSLFVVVDASSGDVVRRWKG